MVTSDGEWAHVLEVTTEQNMKTPLTPLDVDRLKRDAKRSARDSGIPLHKAQAQIAQRQGFPSWELLQRSVRTNAADTERPTSGTLKPDANGGIGAALIEHITAQCVNFIKGLDDASVFRLCWNGSIWISLDDVETGTVSKRSFAARGPVHDGVWSQIGHADGMTPLLNMDGLADRFVLDSDEDDDGNPVHPNHTQLRYTVEVGRAELIEIASYSIDGDLASLDILMLNRDALA